MDNTHITDTIRYIGCFDHDLELFEGQYRVPEGVSYNSYVIMDEKIAIIDTVDQRKETEWLANLKAVLGGRMPDYLVVEHLEPDHSFGLRAVCEAYPELVVVANRKTFAMLGQFCDLNLTGRSLVVEEGETLSLGTHMLTFIMAPMVHWPEVMMVYESAEKVLFSADGFGRFGSMAEQEDWTPEARRYYVNIVGKYGVQVQQVLKKASNLDIKIVCPLHGPVLRDNISFYLKKYDTWSSYEPEEKGVSIAYASMHGNTALAAKKLKALFEAEGEAVSMLELNRADMSEAVATAFRYDKLVLAAPTYDGGLFPAMEDFLYHLQMKNYRKRIIGIVENASWAPSAGKHMQCYAESFKNCRIAETKVHIRSVMREENVEEMKQMVKEMLKVI